MSRVYTVVANGTPKQTFKSQESHVEITLALETTEKDAVTSIVSGIRPSLDT